MLVLDLGHGQGNIKGQVFLHTRHTYRLRNQSILKGHNNNEKNLVFTLTRTILTQDPTFHSALTPSFALIRS